jgi:hypothetical protein
MIGRHLGGLRSVGTGVAAVQFVLLAPQGQLAAFALVTEIKVFSGLVLSYNAVLW